MTFQEKLSDFKDWAASAKDSVMSEEATKTSLILPFFQRVLGYDVFAPTEFVPEYKAGFGDKPADRVDYTVMIDGKPEILVECKHVSVTLNNQHEAQLQGYFASLHAKIAILTNGIVYQFYTDIERANLLDKTPFMAFDVLNQDPALICELEHFRKDKFNAEDIFKKARTLKYSAAIKKFLTEQLVCPTNDFVRAAISRADGMEARSEAIEEMRPLVKSCFAEFINEYSKTEIAVEKSDDTDADRAAIEDEVLAVVQNCVKDIVKPERLSLYRVKKWTSVYYRNCVLCKIFTIDKDYCDMAFPEKFSDPNTNWKNRKTAITYTLANAGEVKNYSDDLIASIKDIDASYDIIHGAKHENKSE